MTATVPTHCPHGGGLLGEGTVLAIYTDGCRSTSGAPVRFWCGPTAMSDWNGVSVTEGEYLAAWDEARFMDENPAKCTFRGLISNRPCTLPLDHDGVHSVWGSVPSMNEPRARWDERDGWVGLAAAEAHAEYLGEVPWSDRVDD